MQLWSIREPVELEQLRQQGYLITNPKLVDPDFLAAYRWISKELEKKTPKPHPDCQFPIWAWQCWDSTRSCRPDLRVRWGEAGKALVRIGFEIPDDLVLLSDFQLWHFVLNRFFLPKNQQEEDCFWHLAEKKDMASQIMAKKRMEQSWQYIFHWQSIDRHYFGEGLGASIQAVCWQIKHEWVHSVQEFRSK